MTELATSMLSPEADHGRWVAFTIAKAEVRLGLSQTALPLNDRMHAILSEAAMRPSELDPDSYALVYLLLQGSTKTPEPE
jgi:hypothetical protein